MIGKVYFWENGMLMVFDENGEQLPEFQGRNTTELLNKIEKAADDKTKWIGFGLEGPCYWNRIIKDNLGHNYQMKE